MVNEHFQRYDAQRQLADKAFKSACYAPYASLYFDQFGFVRACCQNFQHNLGNIVHERLDEIWHGARLQLLRDALRRYDFKHGCEYCKWQLMEGNYNNFAREFDRLPVTQENEFWPAQMEFSISNTCNLECVMCNGEWSSSIRTRREKLPPIRKVYTDQFFNDLRKYLPHLKWLKILGGEPFLALESYRIWDMLIEDNLIVPCHVTTNGTQFNAKVERVLEHLPFSFSVSMDGVTKETVEKVRKNAVHEEVLANFKRFHAYARERGTNINLTYCLIPTNWHEFGDYLLFADEWDVDVCVNTVLHPPEHSLYTRSAEELRPIVEGLLRQQDRILPQLGRNKGVWMAEVDRVKNRFERADDTPLSFLPGPLLDPSHSSTQVIVDLEELALEGQARARLAEWNPGGDIWGIICDDKDTVLDVTTGNDEFVGVDKRDCLGRPFDQVYPLLRMRYGTMTNVHRQRLDRFVDRKFGFTSLDLESRTLRMLTYPRATGGGSVTLATLANKPFQTTG